MRDQYREGLHCETNSVSLKSFLVRLLQKQRLWSGDEWTNRVGLECGTNGVGLERNDYSYLEWGRIESVWSGDK